MNIQGQSAIVTGWSSSPARGRNPFHNIEYQKSAAPSSTTERCRNVSPSTTRTAFPLATSTPPSGITSGRSSRQVVLMLPTTRAVPTAMTHAESPFAARAST